MGRALHLTPVHYFGDGPTYPRQYIAPRVAPTTVHGHSKLHLHGELLPLTTYLDRGKDQC